MSELLHAGVILQDAATTGNGVAVQLGGRARDVAVYVIWNGTITAGAVTIETADTEDYTGTWASLATVSFASDAQNVVTLRGAYRAIRARISTNLVGGTVTVKLYAN